MVSLVRQQRMSDRAIRNRIVEKMLRKRIVGSNNRTIDAVVNMALPSSDQGRGKQLIDDMIADPMGPIQRYGGQRQAITLTSVEDAVDFLKSNDGNVPFNFD